MAAEQGYPPSFYSLGIMYARGEGVSPDLIEAYKWFTLAKRKLKDVSDGSALRMITPKQIEEGLDAISKYLKPEERQSAIARADQWPDRSWIQKLAYPRLTEVKSVRDYNGLCQAYSSYNVGVRQVYPTITEEAMEGKTDLILCITLIEHARMMRACDEREPILAEILYYLNFLDGDDSTAQVPADAAVATALIIGDYCEASQPLAESQQELFARLRQSYREHAGR